MLFSAPVYLALSAAIGVAQVLDALSLLRRPPQGRVRALQLGFSLLEYVWAWVAWRTWHAQLPGVPDWQPAAYLAYVAAMSAAGVLLAVLHRPAEDEQDRPQLPHIPRDLLLAGAVFGAGFALASGWLWLQ